MVDSQMDSTLLSDLVKYCGVFEDVILHEATDFSYPRLATLEITVHQLILTYNASKTSDQRNSSIRRNHSFQDNDNQQENGKEKLEILHTGIDAIERINQSGTDNGSSATNGNGPIEGSLVIRCKNLKIFQLDIRGYEKFKSIAESLDKLLSATIPEKLKSERSDSLIVSKLSFDQGQSPKSPQSPYMPPTYPFHLYPFHYKATFKEIEDGWSLFQPEEEFAKIIHSSSMEWRISYVNIDYSVCPSYPRAVVVPASITDETLKASAAFRKGGRFPVLSYRHTSGNVIVRCGEPLVGPYNKRCKEDEGLLDAFNPTSLGTKGYMIDTRNAAGITSSKVKGGGIEIPTCYPRWKRINRSKDAGPTRYHYLLESYSKLLEACTGGSGAIAGASQNVRNSFDSYSSVGSNSRRDSYTYDKWVNKLNASGWLSHVKDILTCGCLVAQCIERDKSSVLVHGSDGRDITLCVTSLAQVILNPDCRTVTGFEALIEREWLQAGHPFYTRTAKGPFTDIVPSKSKFSAPTFTIFLDCVWQIHHQFPCSFEFNETFLMYLSDNAYSSKFGTFLGDNEGERFKMRVRDETVSLWSYTNRPEVLSDFLNCMYEPNVGIIWPSVAPISIVLWRGMYLRYVIDPLPQTLAERKAHDIVSRHIEARNKVVHLRRKLQDLEQEASKLGLIDFAESCAVVAGKNECRNFKGGMSKKEPNGMKNGGYFDNEEAIMKRTQIFKNMRQNTNASTTNSNSTININPISSDSECSSSVFL